MKKAEEDIATVGKKEVIEAVRRKGVFKPILINVAGRVPVKPVRRAYCPGNFACPAIETGWICYCYSAYDVCHCHTFGDCPYYSY